MSVRRIEAALVAVMLVAVGAISCPASATPASPVVTKLSRTTGSNAGGTKLTIVGRNFRQVRYIKFGRTVVKRFRVITSKKITVRAPAHNVGTVNVVVAAKPGQSKVVRADRFRYYPSPTVTVRGTTHWVLNISYAMRASGFQGECSAENGGVTLWGGLPAKPLKLIANNPVTLADEVDQWTGYEYFICKMTFKVRVHRQPKYALQWTDDTPGGALDPNCDNSKSTADDEIWIDSPNSTSYTRPVMSFTWLCD